VEAFAEAGVECLTLYTFSTENWRRPEREVEGLMTLLREVIARQTEALHKNNVRLRHLGRLDRLSPELREAIVASMELTAQNSGITLSVAFDYGGRGELVDAIQRMIREGTPADAVNEELVDQYLYTSELPDPDLVIRTAGEMRMSNFMLWQAAYAEYYTTPTLWPDFDVVEVDRALQAYRQRRRRFGALTPEE
jgi:undecaprenyl diphosphate synthase